MEEDPADDARLDDPTAADNSSRILWQPPSSSSEWAIVTEGKEERERDSLVAVISTIRFPGDPNNVSLS